MIQAKLSELQNVASDAQSRNTKFSSDIVCIAPHNDTKPEVQSKRDTCSTH